MLMIVVNNKHTYHQQSRKHTAYQFQQRVGKIVPARAVSSSSRVVSMYIQLLPRSSFAKGFVANISSLPVMQSLFLLQQIRAFCVSTCDATTTIFQVAQ